MDRYTVAVWLHLDPEARWTAEQVHEAYHRIVKSFHPDRFDRVELKTLGIAWIKQATAAREKALDWCVNDVPSERRPA